ncbi:MAG: hypothetical protein ABIB47_05410 [Candidatus Woesearchaeota archaeon]
MLFKNKRRVVIVLVSIFLLLLYFSRNLFIAIPFLIAVVALLLFGYIDRSFKLNFPDGFYVFIFIIFILGTIIGGSTPFALYYRIILFDKILHFISPIMGSAIVFYILDRLGISLKWKLLMTVGLVFGILGLFEIGEYLSDVFFGTLHQGVYLMDFAELVKYEVISEPIDDTMWDLILGLFGSSVFAGYKYFESKFRK